MAAHGAFARHDREGRAARLALAPEERAMDVAAWLRDLGLSQYEAAFRENAVDASVLPDLTTEDLREMGVTAIGHRRKLLTAAAALRAPSVPDGAAVPEPGPPATI